MKILVVLAVLGCLAGPLVAGSGAGSGTQPVTCSECNGRGQVQRVRHGEAGRNRAMLLVGGTLFIVIAAGIALVVLSQMLSELQHGERQPTAQAAAPAEDGKF